MIISNEPKEYDKMFKREIYRNVSTNLPRYVMFVENWRLDFHFFEVNLVTNWICEDGRVERKVILGKRNTGRNTYRVEMTEVGRGEYV